LQPLTPDEKKEFKKQFRRYLLTRKAGGQRSFGRHLFKHFRCLRTGAGASLCGFGQHSFGGYGPQQFENMQFGHSGFGLQFGGFASHLHRFGGPYFRGCGPHLHRFGGPGFAPPRFGPDFEAFGPKFNRLGRSRSAPPGFGPNLSALAPQVHRFGEPHFRGCGSHWHRFRGQHFASPAFAQHFTGCGQQWHNFSPFAMSLFGPSQQWIGISVPQSCGGFGSHRPHFRAFRMSPSAAFGAPSPCVTFKIHPQCATFGRTMGSCTRCCRRAGRQKCAPQEIQKADGLTEKTSE
jgi:hypothetical protein